MATLVMIRDSAAAGRQAIFRPTLLFPRGGRFQSMNDLTFRGQALWLEQVDARDGRVRQGIVPPRLVVADAEGNGPWR